MKELLKFLLPFLIFFILIRFFRIIFFLLFKFWFISIPLVVIVYFYFRKKYLRKKEFNNLDPDKEIKIYPEPTIEDEDE